MTPEQALSVIERERLDVLAEGMTEAECQQIAAYVLATEYRKRILGPKEPEWIKATDDTNKCKGVHFLRHEAAVGGEVSVTAMRDGEFYEIRFKVPPFATGDRQA